MNSFSDDDFRDLPPRERRYEIQVADNLFFAVFPNGVKTWVLVYRFEGMVRRQTVGTFPKMPLARALREADKDPGTGEPKAPGPAGERRALQPAVAAGIAASAILLSGAAYMVMKSGSPPDDPGLAQASASADRPQSSLPAEASLPSATPRPGSEPVPAPAPRVRPAQANNDSALPPPARVAEAPASATAGPERQGEPDIPPATPAKPRQTVSGPVAQASAGQDPQAAAMAPVASPGQIDRADASGTQIVASEGADLPPQGPPEARRALLALDVVDREPIGPVSDVLSASPDIQRVYFYTDVRKAGGSDIVHRWLLDGALMAERRFSVGGNYRWRVFSAKDLEPGQLGTWRVELRDGDDRLLAEQSFEYAEDTPRLTVTDGAVEPPGSSSR